MEIWMIWLAAALLALAVELFTGSFFLLVLAIGLGSSALAAYLGAEMPIQITTVAIVSLIGWSLVWRYRSKRAPGSVQPILDAGARVEVLSWSEGNTCRVRYRGAEWRGHLKGDPTESNRYVVSRINGVDLEIVAESQARSSP